MAQQAKVPAIKPDDLSSIPRIYKIKGENYFSLVVLYDPHAYSRMCRTAQAHGHTYIGNK